MTQEAPPTWTIGSILKWAMDDFRAKGLESPRVEAELLLSTALACTRITLLTDSARPLEPAELARFKAMVVRRRRREPIAYILGRREFFGRTFKVDARVLVPRPDTEILVDVALRETRARDLYVRALDLCTGSGCVVITLAKERPTSSFVAVDLSPDALAVAQENALRLGAYNVAFAQGDLFGPVQDARFDLITANPPYVTTHEITTLDADVRDHEPHLALDGGEDGLDLVRRIVEAAPAHLAPEGVLAMEIGADQGPATAELFAKRGFAAVRIDKDYAKRDRVVSGRWQPQAALVRDAQ
jgi:release factor glutamine methyltransferase